MGANPDDQDHTGLSALMHAVISGEDAAVYELLDRPNLALHDRAGNTALDYAIIFSRQRAGQRLVGAGAEADLSQTAALGLRTRVAKISSDPPTLLRVRDARGYSAVQWAILRDQPEVLDLLT